ncbi:hypothetical protein [Roseinatronobacter alkalisoli]|uniref:Cell division topological specificity factor n=1 Tax=Roseinatronobacter alkalisoli TaxID=3028235 RepID=A0ABT5T5S4_9RHOB|nr:hypothetical protein [Roseinatronobacter sp. HJB301]MDD7970447.1 hypothetical protein [Roseinatronobacter sp. HJB301]
MFKFLFGKRAKDPEIIIRETQRETVERAQRELNEILSALEPRAKLCVDLDNGTLAVTLPEQMPDEAKALPAPEQKQKPEQKPAQHPSESAAAPQTSALAEDAERERI